MWAGSFTFEIFYESGGKTMQVFFWIVFIIIIGVALFAVQNSDAPPILIKFLIWKFETSLVYTILGSIGVGILIVLLFWIPKTIWASIHKKD
jgi:uncharacterized integral membrane protein